MEQNLYRKDIVENLYRRGSIIEATYGNDQPLTHIGNTTTTPTSLKIKKYKEPGRLRRSNGASTLLGLTILLYPDKHEYGIAMNHFKGFRVIETGIFELFFICVTCTLTRRIS